MSDNTLAQEHATDAVVETTENQAQAEKTYTQAEFDNHMAGLKNSLTKRFEKQFAELGDLEELKQLKANAEQQKREEAMKRGEFEKLLQELAAKKDAEIQKRDSVIREYKVNTPLLNAAAKYKSVNPEQVRQLLSSQIALNEEGGTDVVDAQGNVRYTDAGTALSVDDLVQEFLNSNPHFVQPAPSTTNTKSSTTAPRSESFDISKLDFKNPEHRERYKKAREEGLI